MEMIRLSYSRGMWPCSTEVSPQKEKFFGLTFKLYSRFRKVRGSKNGNGGNQRGNPWLPEILNAHINTKNEKYVESTEVKNQNCKIMASLIDE